MRQMRRKDRQVTDLAAIRRILEGESHLHLAMCDEGMPYVVPLSYGFELDAQGKLTLYLHAASEGEKLDILRKNDKVCFSIDTLVQNVPVDDSWTAKYRSVIGRGSVIFVEDAAEKQRALQAIVRQAGFEPKGDMPAQTVEHTCVMRVDVAEYTAKSNIPAGEKGSVR